MASKRLDGRIPVFVRHNAFHPFSMILKHDAKGVVGNDGTLAELVLALDGVVPDTPVQMRA